MTGDSPFGLRTRVTSVSTGQTTVAAERYLRELGHTPHPVPVPRTLGHFCEGAEGAMLVQDAVKRRQFTHDSDSAGSRRGAGGGKYLFADISECFPNSF